MNPILSEHYCRVSVILPENTYCNFRHCLQDDQKETDVEYNKAVGEMLDQSLITVVQESHKDSLKEQVDWCNVIISKQVK